MNTNSKSHAGEKQNINLNDKKNHCSSKSSPALRGSQWGELLRSLFEIWDILRLKLNFLPLRLREKFSRLIFYDSWLKFVDFYA